MQQVGEAFRGGFYGKAITVEQLRWQFMAVGNHLLCGTMTVNPSRAKAEDDPLALGKAFMGFSQMIVYIINQSRFGGTPKVGIMAERTIELLPYFDDFLVRKRLAAMETTESLGDAQRVVKHPERIHQGVESQSTAEAAHFVGEAGTQEEQADAVADGLI